MLYKYKKLLENYIESESSSFTHNNRKYKVNDLIKLSTKYKTKKYKVNDLKWILKYSKPEENRKMKPDLSTPLILTSYGDKLLILDGLHRLNYAIENNIDMVLGKFIPKEELNKLSSTSKSIMYIFGEEHNNPDSVKSIQRRIIDIQPDIILSELWWEDKPFFKKYLPSTKVLPLEPDNKNYKNMSLNDSFQIREKYMLNTIKKYYNSGKVCVIVGDTHLRKTYNKEIETNSPIYEWFKNKTNVKIIRSKNNEIK